MICDLGYGDKNFEYSNNNIVGLADNAGGIVPAKNVLIFIAQSVAGGFPMVLSYYFVKNLNGTDLKKYLVANLIELKAKSKLRAIAWGSDHGAENMGCRKALGMQEKSFHGSLLIVDFLMRFSSLF